MSLFTRGWGDGQRNALFTRGWVILDQEQPEVVEDKTGVYRGLAMREEEFLKAFVVMTTETVLRCHH